MAFILRKASYQVNSLGPNCPIAGLAGRDIDHALCPLVQVAWAFWMFLCHDLLCIGWRTNSRANW